VADARITVTTNPPVILVSPEVIAALDRAAGIEPAAAALAVPVPVDELDERDYSACKCNGAWHHVYQHDDWPDEP